MTEDSTLAGYVRVHDRPPAFAGADGAAYSAEVYVDETPGTDGRYGGAVLFVRWSDAGERPVGHLETPYLSYGATPEEAARQVGSLTLMQVKEWLDRVISRQSERPSW